jgi:hypothetical protein
LKRTRLNRISKRPLRALELEADALWSVFILALTGNRCAKCGVYGCHAAHIVARDNKFLRHHKKNGLPLCPKHHRWADEEDPEAFKLWLMHNWPDRYAMYFEQWKPNGTIKRWFLEETIESLKGIK